MVVDVRRVNDRLMTIGLVVGGVTFNVISAYAPQLIIGGDFSGHIEVTTRGYDELHGGFGFGVRNEGGTTLLDFAKALDLVLTNSCFQKREEQLVTFWSKIVRTQTDYLLLQRSDKGLCTDCKIIPSECLSMQRRLLVMDLARE
nr:PREDICTED: craniofacial development protein 2-like [Nicotiana tabacum]